MAAFEKRYLSIFQIHHPKQQIKGWNQKIKGWNQKIKGWNRKKHLSIEKGKSSEPKLHDFGFKMLIL